MKNGFVIFLTAFFALGLSFLLFVLEPQLELGGAKQVAILNSSDIYPIQRTGAAALGLQVYRANGCAACHTTQVQQDKTVCDVVLLKAGTKGEAVSNLLATLKLDGLTEKQADAVSDQVTALGGKTETHIVPVGPDLIPGRGWGTRHSVAEDFLYDYPVQLGALRAGPDLANVGARLPDATWQMLHLYAPQTAMPGSLMPSFRYLFATQKIGSAPSPDALKLPKELAPADGYEIVPTTKAKELVAYLLSLNAEVPLYDAPYTPPATTKP